MSDVDESFEQRFARLSAETENVVPRADFSGRVMSCVERERPPAASTDWMGQMMGMARISVAVAAMAAVAFFAVAWESSYSADEEEALAYGVAEAFE